MCIYFFIKRESFNFNKQLIFTTLTILIFFTKINTKKILINRRITKLVIIILHFYINLYFFIQILIIISFVIHQYINIFFLLILFFEYLCITKPLVILFFFFLLILIKYFEIINNILYFFYISHYFIYISCIINFITYILYFKIN